MKLNAVYTCLPILFLFVIYESHHATAQLNMNNFIEELDSGPVVKMVCHVEFSTPIHLPIITWLFQDRKLAVNDVVETDSSRYTVAFEDTHAGKFIYKSTFNIHNAVPEDEGLYKCQIEYRQRGRKTLMDTVEVHGLSKYLPLIELP